MVGRNLFLTASHCVSDESVGHYVAFGYQLDSDGSGTQPDQHHTPILEIVEDGIDADHVYDGGLDYAIVRVSDIAGYSTYDHFGPYELPIGWRPVFQSMPNEAAIIQHPGGLHKQVDAGTAIQYGDDNTEISYADIDTQGGSSGSGVLDRFGRIVGVHTTGGCHTSAGVNSGVTMESILSFSQVLDETVEPAYISNFHVHPYSVNDPVQVNLTSSPNPFVLMSQNLDDTRYLPIFWNKPNDSEMRIQIRVDGGNWSNYALYDRYVRVGRLCLSSNRGNGIPPGCDNAPAIYEGLIEFRFRLEGAGGNGPWRYLRPVDLYHNS